jgi:hypothetical protein
MSGSGWTQDLLNAISSHYTDRFLFEDECQWLDPGSFECYARAIVLTYSEATGFVLKCYR